MSISILLNWKQDFFSFGLDTNTQSLKYTTEMHNYFCLFSLILYVAVNNFTVM